MSELHAISKNKKLFQVRFYIFTSSTNDVLMENIPENRLNDYDKAYSGENKEKRAAKKFADSTWYHIQKLWGNIKNEGHETQQMAEVFFKMLEQKLELDKRSDPPSEEEVKEAIRQLKDVGRIGFFASVSLLPGGAFSLLGLELLARKFGIKNFSFIPSSFRKKMDEKDAHSK